MSALKDLWIILGLFILMMLTLYAIVFFVVELMDLWEVWRAVKKKYLKR